MPIWCRWAATASPWVGPRATTSCWTTTARSPACTLSSSGSAGGWSVRDVSSRNGTFVNGNRLSGEARVGPGDELRIGRTRIVLRADRTADDPGLTEAQAPPPQLTPREKDVLIALFTPMTGPEMFTEPASTRAIAQQLWVSEAAVKQHLLRLYDKFGVSGDGERRRTKLANEALRRGAITLAEVRAAASKDS